MARRNSAWAAGRLRSIPLRASLFTRNDWGPVVRPNYTGLVPAPTGEDSTIPQQAATGLKGLNLRQN